jgi:chromosome segregation ATPase
MYQIIHVVMEERSHQFNERITQIENHVYSYGDINAIQGQIDNLNKNSDSDEHQCKRLEVKILELEKQLTGLTEMYKHLSIACASNQDHWMKVHDRIDHQGQRVTTLGTILKNRSEELESEIKILKKDIINAL